MAVGQTAPAPRLSPYILRYTNHIPFPVRISVFPLDKVKKIRYNKPKGNDGKEYAVPRSHREPVLVEAGTTQPQKILPEPYGEIPRGK